MEWPKKLHIGSGPWYAEGWTNVDVEAVSGFRGPDIYASVLDSLPFEPDYFDQLYMGHFLEHLTSLQIPVALANLRRVCAPTCRIAVVGPCMDLAVAQGSPSGLIEAIRAHGDPPGGHMWTATGAKTQAVLEEAGLIVDRVEIGDIRQPEWCNPNHTALWQCAMFARWDNS
jgi:hypothetical protein